MYEARALDERARTVRIGTFGSLSGPDSALGRELQQGLESAVLSWNQGADGARVHVELRSYDDQSRATAAARACERLVSDDHVALIVGGLDPAHADSAAAAVPEALLVCPSCPAGSTSRALGLSPSCHERAELLAELVVRTMRVERVQVLVRADVASDHAMASAFADSFAARGGRPREPIGFTPATITDVLGKLAAEAPQAVLVALDGREAALVGRAMRRRAVPSALLFSGTPDLSILPEADRLAALEGALFPGSRAEHQESGAGTVASFALERRLLASAAVARVAAAFAGAASGARDELWREISTSRLSTPLEVARVERGRFLLAFSQ